MADDGILMNFTIGDDPLGTRSVFKGGRWKDRLQAKRNLQRRKEKRIPQAENLTGSNTIPTKPRDTTQSDDISRSAKRQKLDGSHHVYAKIHGSVVKPREVVSSLFTYNPTSSSATAQTQAEEVPAPEPSNAPLPTSASPFVSLGLSPFLSTHLIQNLSLTAPTAIQKAAITQLLRQDSDAFIQAETGSGKTLAYLLPILQRILALSKTLLGRSLSGPQKKGKLDRTSGLFALILAPTRELTHQISSVLTRLLRPLPWLVAGTVTGGSTKNHEKSRIRKGINILVATPGRLADHFENTEVLDVSSVRWLVLDEGDRLMELGFEDEIRSIVKKLDERKGKIKIGRVKVEGLPESRTTVLCSATMKMGVQRLGEISLKDAVHIKAETETSSSPKAAHHAAGENAPEKETTFLAPAQLKQSYIVVPPKQRLVTLAALLKRTFARKGSVMKAIVFLSCADSVDFHFEVFARKDGQPPKETISSDQSSKSNKSSHKNEALQASPPKERMMRPNPTEGKPDLRTAASACSLASTSNPFLKLWKLHGSLEQKLRTATLQTFTRSTGPSILLCTDVASRGLDLPNIDLVVEYDPPFSSDDHLHRVGRTARAGKEGRACCFLMSGPEEGYVKVLKEAAGGGLVKGEAAEEVLKRGFASSEKDKTNTSATGTGEKWEVKATDWQLEVERWVIDDKRAGEMARRAFVSHVRAYATHVIKERCMFDVKGLHLGHLAKAFALRERPGNMGRGTMMTNCSEKSRTRDQGERRKDADGAGAGEDGRGVQRRDEGVAATTDEQDAARKMRSKMREQAMGGASEFNIG